MLLAILVFANWSSVEGTGVMAAVARVKWPLTASAAAGLGVVLVAWFGLPLRRVLVPGLVTAGTGIGFPGAPAVPFVTGTLGLTAATSTREGEMEEWFGATWTFTKQILPLLLGGTVVTEAIFGWPGMGRLFWKASNAGDIPVTMGILFLIAVLVVVFQLITDIVYTYFDPRIRYE